ncbi:helix-turn-helix domain-containing protein [Lysinibacillus antri]|uniref:XRE family transcriptional regulator n=1 Tax=Lysinibacillus antri TaxID=2498145 RepID=A0A432LFR0_9BACI|nr:helix-turn-helix transcriptional regulator [Lysinibacillus antri]RUL56497.1 XRE family transcriptional regulator [Lysinibacillus antri]
METLGEFIKQLRGKESLRDASKRIGISHTYLDTIEKGYDKRSGKNVNPTPETLKLISNAYNCSYEELMRIAGYLDNGNVIEIDVAGEKISLTPEEFEVLNQLKKHAIAFENLKSNPEKKVKQMVKSWKTMQEALKEIDDDDSDYLE